jgi:hypothetical protein
VPSEDDILYARASGTAILETRFSMGGFPCVSPYLFFSVMYIPFARILQDPYDRRRAALGA